MSQPIHALLLQRERARQKVIVVTAGSAIGATALAVAFGAVLGGPQPAAAAPRTPAASTPEATGAPVRQVEAVTEAAQTGHAAAPARATRSRPAAAPRPTYTPLRAPAQAPRPADEETAQAPSGAS